MDFEDVINDMNKKVSYNKIAMYEKMKKVNNNFLIGMKKKKHLDHIDGKIFDSSYCIMVPRI